MNNTEIMLSSLSCYMLNNANITNILNNIPTINNKEKKIIDNTNANIGRKDLFYYPNGSCDTLFWCINIFTKGMDVMYSSNNKFTSEKNEKFLLVPLLRNSKQLLKNEKIKLKNVEGNLSVDANITFETLIALAIVLKFNVIYTTEILFYEKIFDPSWKTCYIKKNRSNHGVWIKEKDPDYYEIKGNKIVVDNIDKPLKTLSSYKKGELQDICKKLKIQFEFEGQKKFTKKKLYSLIQEQLN